MSASIRWQPITPFSVEVGKMYAAELAQKLARCPMNARAKRSEVKEFARYAIECYLGQKNQDWVPGSRAPSAVSTLNQQGGN
jgi:hypothetical protein